MKRTFLCVAWLAGVLAGLLFGAWGQLSQAAEIWVGAATANTTPDKPAVVQGQFYLRISKAVETPLTATVVVLDAREAGKSVDQAILVSCDLSYITADFQQKLCDRLHKTVPELDGRKLVLTATHTHTAPPLDGYWYVIPKEGVVQPEEYVELLVERISQAAADAWKRRQAGAVSWGLGHAVVGHNRRSVYADGKAIMYGPASKPEFQNFESGEDHGIEMLFFWDRQQRPLAVAVNVVCPSQEVEGRTVLSADFWHDVREQLGARHKNLCVLGWPGAAGDQSPHEMYRRAAEDRMRKLRGLTNTQEIGRRIAREVEDVMELTRQDLRTDVPLVHRVEDMVLPKRKITEEDLAAARAKIEEIDKKKVPARTDRTERLWHQAVVDRYQKQDKEPQHTIEVHALRIGDVAIVTNPFELFLDYGLRIKTRSKAPQTFLVQLTAPWSGYLPTKKAIAGGGYSAIAESGLIGSEGGQILVDRSVEMINAMW